MLGRASRASQTQYAILAQMVTWTSLPQDLNQATVTVHASHIVCTRASADRPDTPNAAQQGFPDVLAGLDDDMRWALSNASNLGLGAQIAAAIAAGRCIGISNGLFRESFGTAAWTLVDRDNENIQMSRECVVPGGATNQSAFRSEVLDCFRSAPWSDLSAIITKCTTGMLRSDAMGKRHCIAFLHQHLHHPQEMLTLISSLLPVL